VWKAHQNVFLPLVDIAAVDPVLAVLSPFLLAALLKFVALFAAVAHRSFSYLYKRPSPSTGLR